MLEPSAKRIDGFQWAKQSDRRRTATAGVWTPPGAANRLACHRCNELSAFIFVASVHSSALPLPARIQQKSDGSGIYWQKDVLFATFPESFQSYLIQQCFLIICAFGLFWRSCWGALIKSQSNYIKMFVAMANGSTGANGNSKDGTLPQQKSVQCKT